MDEVQLENNRDVIEFEVKIEKLSFDFFVWIFSFASWKRLKWIKLTRHFGRSIDRPRKFKHV